MAACDEEMTDAAWEEFRKELYERRRLKGVELRRAEAAHRKAGGPPPTLLEAIEAHYRAKPRLPVNTLTPTSRTTSRSAESSLDKLAALFADDPVLLKLGEAAALTPVERFERYGWLVHLPHALLAKMPPHMLTDEYRFELPAWALKAKYDALREDHLLEILDLRLDKSRADKLIADRKYAAKPSTKVHRAMHPDELNLPAAAQEHLKKLRARLAIADRTLRSAEGATFAPARVNSARSYVASVEATIRAARVSYGLSEVEADSLTS